LRRKLTQFFISRETKKKSEKYKKVAQLQQQQHTQIKKTSRLQGDIGVGANKIDWKPNYSKWFQIDCITIALSCLI
jgi:hypothetical protein